MTDKYLTGKVAWVTGGASGMGRATALALARAGANVAVGSLLASQRKAVLKDQNCHTPPDDALASAKGEIESQGVRAIGMALDVCSMRLKIWPHHCAWSASLNVRAGFSLIVSRRTPPSP